MFSSSGPKDKGLWTKMIIIDYPRYRHGHGDNMRYQPQHTIRKDSFPSSFTHAKQVVPCLGVTGKLTWQMGIWGGAYSSLCIVLAVLCIDVDPCLDLSCLGELPILEKGPWDLFREALGRWMTRKTESKANRMFVQFFCQAEMSFERGLLACEPFYSSHGEGRPMNTTWKKTRHQSQAARHGQGMRRALLRLTVSQRNWKEVNKKARGAA